MQTTLPLNSTLTAVLSETLDDEKSARLHLVARRQHSHSVQEAERLDIALKQVVGYSYGQEQLGIRRRAYATLRRGGELSARPAGVAQWYVALQELLTCEGVFLRADVTMEAFWCDPLAAEAGLDGELAAAIAEAIAQEVAQFTRNLQAEFTDAATLWTLDCAPAAYHVAEELKLEVSVALMNEVYGQRLQQAALSA